MLAGLFSAVAGIAESLKTIFHHCVIAYLLIAILLRICKPMTRPKLRGKKLKRILVTGGAGFLVRICVRLLNEGENVVCLDSFTRSEQNVIDHPKPKFHHSFSDVAMPTKMDVDQILIGMPGSPVQYQHDPGEQLKLRCLARSTYWIWQLPRRSYSSGLHKRGVW